MELCFLSVLLEKAVKKDWSIDNNPEQDKVLRCFVDTKQRRRRWRYWGKDIRIEEISVRAS